MPTPKTKAAAKAAREKLENKSLRKARTLSLNNDQYETLQKYCALDGTTVSEVVDALIEAYLEQVDKG